MAVFRVERNTGYTVMSNHHLRNKELTLKAKGLLSQIRNIKQYLRAALFNAPSTIGNYYTSLVAHDMASGALAPRKPRFGDPDYYSCNEGESL